MNPLWLLTAALAGTPITDDMVRASITKGVQRLETAATNYTKNRNCFSCHHQAVPVMALVAAKNRGFKIGDAVLPQQVKFTLDSFKPRLKEIRGGSGIGGANTTAAYALQTLQVTKHTSDETTEALIEFLLKKQKDDGSWQPTMPRPPSEGSFFNSTALALQAFAYFSSLEADALTNDDMKKRLRQARLKGLKFLETGKVESTEDRVFRLWGLVVGRAGEEAIRKAKDDLLKRQRPDGGWSQLDDMTSDAYATGSVLTALRMGGVSPTEDAYREGVRHLVLSQHESGAWIVTTRSKPIQKLFDNGDPGEKSQFISTAATGWAVLALAECCEKK